VSDQLNGGSIVARHSSGPRAGSLVTTLTVVALGVVAFFAYQASAADDTPLAAPATDESADPSGGADGGPGGKDDGRGEEPDPLAVPADSGTGERVVYSVGERRVWLVEDGENSAGDAVTHEVYPSTIDPPPGEYVVTSRASQGTGSDGVLIEHTMVFHVADDGVVFGFSSALDGSTPDSDSEVRTGGIRQSREDGDAMWVFAEVGTPVVVVP
jgi:hypothetical protein